MFPNVLVVEPYADLRASIVTVLQRRHFQCDSVATADAALLKLREQHYAYLVVDVDPTTDAFVASLDPDAKVILLSDDDPREPRANEFAMLQKPFSREELLAQFAEA
jgi:DNA-binding response OmpR family regulator